MNSKKSLTTIIAIIVILGVSVLLWRSGGVTPSSTLPTDGTIPGTESGIEGQTGVGSVGEMTDEIYVEIISQTAYNAQKDPAAYASNMENLYKKYGVTEENVMAYGEALGKDITRAQAVAQKYAQRLQELQNAGE